ncbi:hypothetical protein KY289_001137 [Solanum tuberosum]|nr:hypothetical protein KY289_001137 [Solanum tuberosum]
MKPTFNNGIPLVTWMEEEVTCMNIMENLQYVVIGKFSYECLELDELRRIIPKQCNIKGACQIELVMKHHRLWHGYPSLIFGLFFFGIQAIFSLASAMGDIPKFVELDIENEETISSRVEKVKVVYDMLSKYYNRCKLQGPNEEECIILHPELRKQEQNADMELNDKELSKPSRFLTKQWNPTNRRFIRNTYKEVTIAGMELEKDVIMTNNSFNTLNEEQDEGEKNKWEGGGE